MPARSSSASTPRTWISRSKIGDGDAIFYGRVAKIRGLDSLINEQLVAASGKAKAEVAQAVEAVAGWPIAAAVSCALPRHS